MFEKESEEYADDWLKYVKDLELHRRRHDERPEHFRIMEAYKNGAEFGYNKANEWHYVKDGDLPKAYQKCYFIYSNYYNKEGKVDFSESSVRVRTGLYCFYDDEEGEETTDPCFYDDIIGDEIDPSEVYAWKEIVLPELKGGGINGKERT